MFHALPPTEKKKEGKQNEEFKSRLFVGDETFGFARSWCDNKKDANKIVATCIPPLEEVQTSASQNIKALKSKGATVIGGVYPAKLDDCLEICGKNFNSIHIQFPEPGDETKSFFSVSMGKLRGFGAVEVLLEPRKVEEVKGLAMAVGLKEKKMENFVGSKYKYYKVPGDKDSSAPAPPENKGEKKKQISAGFKGEARRLNSLVAKEELRGY